jgi:hypothetical protein
VVGGLHHRSVSGGGSVHGGVCKGGEQVKAEVVLGFLKRHPVVWLVPSFAVNVMITGMWFWLHVLLWGKLLQGLEWFCGLLVGE